MPETSRTISKTAEQIVLIVSATTAIAALVCWWLVPAGTKPVAIAENAPFHPTPVAKAGPGLADIFPARAGYVTAGFDRLANFPFIAPSANPMKLDDSPSIVTDQIPADIQRLDGQKACVCGFMLPIKMEDGRVTQFLLVSSPMLCCYGITPRTNEWVVVDMAAGHGVRSQMDVPTEFYGTLHVGPTYESGALTGIYRLDGEGQNESRL